MLYIHIMGVCVCVYSYGYKCVCIHTHLPYGAIYTRFVLLLNLSNTYHLPLKSTNIAYVFLRAVFLYPGDLGREWCKKEWEPYIESLWGELHKPMIQMAFGGRRVTMSQRLHYWNIHIASPEVLNESIKMVLLVMEFPQQTCHCLLVCSGNSMTSSFSCLCLGLSTSAVLASVINWSLFRLSNLSFDIVNVIRKWISAINSKHRNWAREKVGTVMDLY